MELNKSWIMQGLIRIFRAIKSGYFWMKMLDKYNAGFYGDALRYYDKSRENAVCITSKLIVMRLLLLYKLDFVSQFIEEHKIYSSHEDLCKSYNKDENNYLENFVLCMVENMLGKNKFRYNIVKIENVSSDLLDLFRKSDLDRSS